MEMRTEGTGIYVTPRASRNIPPFNPRTREHLWVIGALWNWNPDEPKGSLDHENLLSLDAPCCYYCEQWYDTRLKFRLCPGKPRD